MSGRQDLNLRPPAPKAGALPNCATSRFSFLLNLQNLVGSSVSEGKLYITHRKKENRQLKHTFEGFKPFKNVHCTVTTTQSLSFREPFPLLEFKTTKIQGRHLGEIFTSCGFRSLEFEEAKIKKPAPLAKNRILTRSAGSGGNDGNRTRVFSLEG